MHRTTNPPTNRSARLSGPPHSTVAAPPLDHHLWRNGHLWWIAITLYDGLGLRRRVRRSLGTDDVVEARRRRDQFVDRLRSSEHWTIAASTLRSRNAGSGVAA